MDFDLRYATSGLQQQQKLLVSLAVICLLMGGSRALPVASHIQTCIIFTTCLE